MVRLLEDPLTVSQLCFLYIWWDVKWAHAVLAVLGELEGEAPVCLEKYTEEKPKRFCILFSGFNFLSMMT